VSVDIKVTLTVMEYVGLTVSCIIQMEQDKMG